MGGEGSPGGLPSAPRPCPILMRQERLSHQRPSGAHRRLRPEPTGAYSSVAQPALDERSWLGSFMLRGMDTPPSFGHQVIIVLCKSLPA